MLQVIVSSCDGLQQGNASPDGGARWRGRLHWRTWRAGQRAGALPHQPGSPTCHPLFGSWCNRQTQMRLVLKEQVEAESRARRVMFSDPAHLHATHAANMLCGCAHASFSRSDEQAEGRVGHSGAVEGIACRVSLSCWIHACPHSCLYGACSLHFPRSEPLHSCTVRYVCINDARPTHCSRQQEIHASTASQAGASMRLCYNLAAPDSVWQWTAKLPHQCRAAAAMEWTALKGSEAPHCCAPAHAHC